MKKWYFSKNGKISGPLTLDESLKFLTKDPDFYGWHPSFNQWRPVSCIAEFDDVVPTPVPPAQIPPELIQEFVDKKQSLHDKIDIIDEKIDNSSTSMYELEQEIKIYKRITQNLSDEVKENINSIEQHYSGLQKTLTELKKVTDIANNEIDEIVTDFDSRVAEKSSENAVPVKKNSSKGKNTESSVENKIKLASTADKNVGESKQQTSTESMNDGKGFGSRLKSVFNESTAKTNKSDDLDDALADLVATEAVNGDDALDEASEEENKASRMRRRRRRR